MPSTVQETLPAPAGRASITGGSYYKHLRTVEPKTVPFPTTAGSRMAASEIRIHPDPVFLDLTDRKVIRFQ